MRALPRPEPSTADRALDVAEQLVQTRGFNGFSYADIAQALGITKASLHYHFPTKAALGERLVARYHEAFLRALADIDRTARGPADRLRRYVKLYTAVLRKDRMCLCGMLAAEHSTLPKGMKEGLRRFFDANERWLVEVLDQGQRTKELRFAGSPQEAARLVLGTLEGAMLLARSYGEIGRFQSAATRLLADLGA